MLFTLKRLSIKLLFVLKVIIYGVCRNLFLAQITGNSFDKLRHLGRA